MGRTFQYTIFIVLLVCSQPGLGQTSDTLHPATNDQIANQLENIAENTDLQLDFSDLTDDYLYLSEHPVNINDAKIQKLAQLHLLNEFQLLAIQNYINQNGPLLSKYELALIPAIDKQTLERIQPFIKILPSPTKKLSIRKALKFGQQALIFRGQRLFEKAKAYQTPADSAFEHPGSVYLGSPEKLYLRYGFNGSDRVRFGFTAEKDAGEVLPFTALGDSVMHLLHNKKPVFPDFFSAFAYVSDMGILKKAIIGDYHLEFGQGLSLWSGLHFGKSANACDVKYYGRGIIPSTSVNENHFFRGAAATLGKQNIDLTIFYSNQKADGNLLPSDSLGNLSISSLPESGNHRSINELLDKNRVQIQAYGMHMAFTHRTISLGVTYYRSLFNPSIAASYKPYQRFYFRGNKMQNAGIDFNYLLQKIIFFGEFSGNGLRNLSGILGFKTYLNDRFQLSLLYRNISRSYQVFYASPFIENSRVNNEQGIYLGCTALLAKHLQLAAYADYFTFPWLKYRVNSPSMGKAFLWQLSYTTQSALSIYLRYRHKEKQENYGGNYDFTDKIETGSTDSYRFAITYRLFDFLSLKNRLEWVRTEHQTNLENGILFYQDILYRPQSFPLVVSFRYALFDTDGWESRIYAYENDVRYAFSIPSFYGKGQKIYLLLRWKPCPSMTLWLRLARTTWFDRTTIGSGADLIKGNHKTEVKVQALVKL
jgi:hypothetical protein